MKKGNRSFKDETGKVYGRLTVLSRNGIDKSGCIKWNCRCECGAEKEISGHSLRNGSSQSCGCLQIERTRTHGKTKTKAYKAWQQMKQRCTNPNAQYFHRWGGRGITFCSDWERFDKFLADMGEPSAGMSLDRIDNDGNYEPSNCRWATNKEQSQNTSFNVLNAEAVKVIKYMLKHKKCTQAKLAMAYRISKSNISHIHRGKTWKNVEV